MYVKTGVCGGGWENNKSRKTRGLYHGDITTPLVPSLGLSHTGAALLVHQLWHEASKVVVTWLPQKHPPHGPPRTPHHSKSLTMAPHGLGISLREYAPG